MKIKFFIPLWGFTLLAATAIFAQNDPSVNSAPQKYALVIGNGTYTGGLSRLANPVNDAMDIAAVLEHLGFAVDMLIDSTLIQMDAAVLDMRERLGQNKNSYGFFFYAGHGVQSGGENFLIPVNASIPNEHYLRDRAVSLQSLLDNLNDAGNRLNVVVLDACRDTPFGWSRSGSRGLLVVNRQPVDSIIVYATGAGQVAADGEGRNGLFTGQLLINLATPGIEVSEVFKRTGADVSAASGRKQIPAVYNQFFGTAYLGMAPNDAGSTEELQRPIFLPQKNGQTNKVDAETRLWSLGASAGTSFARPWLVGTIRGTLAPFRYSFLELGMDIGTFSGKPNAGYFSIYPYTNYAYFLPFDRGGWYIGTGIGYLWSLESTLNSNYYHRIIAMNIMTGFNIANALDISYTIRTDFKGVSNKFSVGYAYRFQARSK
ncbi:MAG: caspase family protein [Treponema sp.]|nr:caspase family protein [Treponema sp.]